MGEGVPVSRVTNHGLSAFEQCFSIFRSQTILCVILEHLWNSVAKEQPSVAGYIGLKLRSEAELTLNCLENLCKVGCVSGQVRAVMVNSKLEDGSKESGVWTNRAIPEGSLQLGHACGSRLACFVWRCEALRSPSRSAIGRISSPTRGLPQDRVPHITTHPQLQGQQNAAQQICAGVSLPELAGHSKGRVSSPWSPPDLQAHHSLQYHPE